MTTLTDVYRLKRTQTAPAYFLQLTPERDVIGLQADLFGGVPPSPRPSALALAPLEGYVSLTEALRRIGERMGLSRPTLYTMGVADALREGQRAHGYARKRNGDLRRCAYRVALSHVEEVLRRVEAGEVIPPVRNRPKA